MFQAASETLLELGRDRKYLGAEIGFTSILHTWGQNLIHHPHVHCVVPSGGLSLVMYTGKIDCKIDILTTYANVLEVLYMKKLVKVVGAVIENDNNEVLCALRSPDMSLPNMWKFPGGKVEPNEELAVAIVSEIKEELQCDIECKEVFNNNTHEYENFIINLITMECKILNGTPIACEHAKLIWLRRECLESLVWSPADIPTAKQLLKGKV